MTDDDLTRRAIIAAHDAECVCESEDQHNDWGEYRGLTEAEQDIVALWRAATNAHSPNRARPSAHSTGRRPTVADDRIDRAVDTIAASIVARAADTEIRDSYLEYADLGEDNWQRITDAVERLTPFPDANAVDDAYEYLFRRARGQEATP